VVSQLKDQNIAVRQEAPLVTDLPIAQVTANSTERQHYVDEKFGIAFDYPATWRVQEQFYADENHRQLDITEATLGIISIQKLPNLEFLTPHGWYEKNKDDYNAELFSEIANTVIQNTPLLIMGQPATCRTYPMLVAILQSTDAIFVITHYELGARTQALELDILLETLSFDGQPYTPFALPTAFITFPEAPDNVICPQVSAAATSNARICPGADMYIPTEGEMKVPWKCFNDDPYCSPYRTRPANDPGCGYLGIFCNPHSGLDIFGGAGLDVTPVYASYNGIARKIAASAVRIDFAAPHTGESVYMTHMAHGSDDYREVNDGDLVIAGVTLIGRQGDYNVEQAGVHLHLSYSNARTDLFDKGVLDPTEFLKADNLVYYSGWNHTGQPVTCSSGGSRSSVDVALIIDSSGSMGSNDPANLRKAAAKVFIDAMQDTDQVSVIDFDDFSRVAWALQLVGNNRNAAKAAVDTIDSFGGTNIGSGLDTGFAQLNASTSSNTKAAVLLTDGQGSYSNQAARFKDKGWRIFTIGLSSSADRNLLQRIASETGGLYYDLNDPQQLVDVYFEIFGAVVDGTTVRQQVTRLQPLQTSLMQANVPSGQTTANFLTTWQGSIVDTKLIAPNGQIITSTSSDPDIAHSKGSTFELYRVTDPQNGNWTIEIYGAELPIGGEDVGVTVAVRGLAGQFSTYVDTPAQLTCTQLEWTAEAWVLNNTNSDFTTGIATISLPSELALAAGQMNSQTIGNIVQGEQAKTEWRLAANTTALTQTFTFSVTSAFNQGAATPLVATANIMIPQCIYHIGLTIDSTELVANGISTTIARAEVRDIANRPMPYVTVDFDTSRGVINGPAMTNFSGVATVTLTSPTSPGIATVTATSGNFNSSATIKFTQSATTPGDCNGDQSITASDITALAFEFFDGDDNNNPAATSGGSYPGNPGCDANGDTHIGASDINCMALLFFNGAGACSRVTTTTVSASPVLSIPSQLTVAPNSQVTVPLLLQTNASAVGSLLFSLDYDETQLSFDPADNNQDGIPDAISFNLPAQYMRAVMFNPEDADGELDFMIANFAASPVALADGTLLFVTLDVGQPSATTEAAINFSQAPAASFGDTQGRDLSGATANGSVLITVPPTPSDTQSTIYLPFISQNR